ncbi:MAG: hypothetical protein NC485_05065 [Ruminococcus flavefaciens]|nr:hypothetical protein [Ruminococcus flavefaciens]MCM1060776.1 hypothetical protein [Eubacterium sp.]
MEELKNYTEIHTTNAVLIDILSRYAENSALAEFVAEDGSINLKLNLTPPVDVPSDCEQAISFMFNVIEQNPDTTIGKIYLANQKDILRDVVCELSRLMDGFSNIKITIHTTLPDEKNPEAEVSQHTEFTLSRSKSTTVENK